MGTYDFSIQESKDLVKANDYIIIQAGKGKKENSSIHINYMEFSYIEGLIWDKYREYGTSVKTKISSSEWVRILEGFSEGITDLSKMDNDGDLKSILKFNLFKAKNTLVDMEVQADKITKLLEALILWITPQMKQEKHLTIIKDRA